MNTLSKIWLWLVALIVKKQVERIIEDQPIPMVEEARAPPARRARADKSEARRNFSELLDHLESTFDAIKLPPDKLSWLTKDEITGLRRLGVHVPNPWLMLVNDDPATIRCDVSSGVYPSFLCVTMAHSDQVPALTDDAQVPLKIIFGIKQKKLPAMVTQHPGVPYQFGFAFEVDGKLFWIGMFITIRRSGEIILCDELRTRDVVIPITNAAERRRHYGGATRTVHVRGWKPSVLIEDPPKPGQMDPKTWTKNVVRGTFNWWVTRDSRWSVAVKKKGERVTFGVEQENTKRYFADRDKTVKTTTGATKKIIHYVREHERKKANGGVTTVSEHIRGLREFDWKGFHCIVTAPKFHGATAAAFDVPAETLPPEKGVCLSKVGQVLADWEERDRRVA